LLAGGLLTAVWGLWLFRPAASSILPLQRQRAVPWSGWEILCAFFVYYLASGIALSVVAGPKIEEKEVTGLIEELNAEEPEVREKAQQKLIHLSKSAEKPIRDALANDPTPELKERLEEILNQQTARTRAPQLLAQLVGAVIGLLAAIGIPWFVSHTRPYQLGLSTSRLGSNLFLGIFAVFCLTPLVMGCFFTITDLMQKLNLKPEEHPLTELGRSHPGPIDWLLMTLNAAVAAPMIEELLARGLFQRWLTTRNHGWEMAIYTALILSLLPQLLRIQDAILAHVSLLGLIKQLPTTFFVLATVPPFLVVRRYVPSLTVSAVYGSSLAFAAAHAAVWPSPVPLFVLAIGLGMLAYRTQSLIPSIVAHSLFNVFNLILINQQLLDRIKILVRILRSMFST
jgi:membrane protease YdiL (CAAX protease family)